MAEIRQAFCPMCGRVVGARATKYTSRRSRRIMEKVNHWQDLRDSYDLEKPFGILREDKDSLGSPSLKVLRYLSPEEMPEYHEPMRELLALAVEAWVRKGWVEPELIQAALQRGMA